MHIDGISAAGAVSRSVGSATTAPASGAVAGDRHATGDVGPTYFRSISPITPGSLAAAYKAIRAQESAAARLAVPPVPGNPAGMPQGTILSGEGIPAAMRGYQDVIDA